jgi:hypothetical protein
VTVIVSAGDRTDPIASYNFDAILLTLLAGLAASFALDPGRLRKTAGLAALAGALASLTLLTKQTVGLGALLSISLAGAVLLAKTRPNGLRRAAAWCAGFAAGAVVPLLAAAAWLWKLHVLSAYLRMLFVTGPAAKAGHLSDLLTRQWTVARGNPVWVSLAILAVVLSWRPIQRAFATHEPRQADGGRQTLWVLAAGLLVIGAALLLSRTSLPALHDFSKSSVYFVVLGLSLWLIFAFRHAPTLKTAQAILFLAVAWSIAATLSLSWPAFEAMTLPGLGFLLAATLDGVRDRFKWFPLLVMAAMVFIQVREKLDMPFGFDHLDESPVRFETAASSQPQLRGLRLAPSMADFLDSSVRTIKAHTSTQDTIFTYPELGLLYTLTDRRPPTFASSHNIDVVSDAFARDEALRLKQNPPAVIVYYRVSEEDLKADELTWRNGRRSGQRDLIAAVESLVAGYTLDGEYIVAPGDPPIDVYVRR